MPSYNLPVFPSLTSPPSSPPLPSKPSHSHRRTHSSPTKPTTTERVESNPMARREGKRPVLSIIQPSNSPTSSKGKDKLLPPLPLSSSSRSNSSPTRSTPRPIPIRATSSPSSLSQSHTASAPSPPQPQPRRRPLSRRYTRPPSLLTSRSPLQSHSIPSFSHNHPQHAPNTTLFEELLMRNLERRFGERLNQFKSAGEKVQGLGGALKPGRELLIWSAVNRCKVPSRSSSPPTRGNGGVESWKESGLKKGGGHKRSHTLPDLRKVSKKEEEDDDNDDEPLARQLEEVIKKRQEQYERIQVERVRKSFEEEKEKRRTETVKVKLPKSPEPANLKPLLTTTPVETGGGDTRAGKKSRTLSPTAQPFLPSSPPPSCFSPRWLPTLPERVATLSSSPSPPTPHILSTPPFVSRSKSDSGISLSPPPSSSYGHGIDTIVVEEEVREIVEETGRGKEVES